MMYPLTFMPDMDTAWSVNPGACKSMDGLAPLQDGAYGSVSGGTILTCGTAAVLSAYMFRQVSGSVRFLVFRSTAITEYDSAGTGTDRVTGLASSTEWQAAAYGNQIVAVSKAVATQGSTGGNFSALGGSPPKARHVAVNSDFVMLADVDDGGSNNYTDMVWWSAIGNPTSWAASLSTQAGNNRLVDVPGPITALVSYRDNFVVFKDNAIIVGEYVGPSLPSIFYWRVISARVGCVGPQAVCELDGKLYFLHSSGFWEFDGAALRNVGIPVFHSFMAEAAYVAFPTGKGQPYQTNTPEGITKVQAAADDIEGVVWFKTAYTVSADKDAFAVLYGYNVRSGKWGRSLLQTTDNILTTPNNPRLIITTTADIKAFLTDNYGRVWMFTNDSTPNSYIYSVKYPYASTGWTFTTGAFGSNQGSDSAVRVWPRMRKGSTTAAIASGTVTGYSSEDENITNGSASLTANTSFDCMDGQLSAKFKTIALTGGTSKLGIVGGIEIEGVRGGQR